MVVVEEKKKESDTDLKNFMWKKIKVSYNSKIDEVSQDIGFLTNVTPGYIVLKLDSGKEKFISQKNIIRGEEI